MQIENDFVTLRTDVHQKIDLYLGLIHDNDDAKLRVHNQSATFMVTDHVKYTEMPTDNETLFSAYIKIGDHILEKKVN